MTDAPRIPLMKIGKPLILTTTTLGVGLGLYEGYRFAGGLVVLMFALMSLIGVAMGTLVATVRRERREEQARVAGTVGSEPRVSP
jgi:hypothetical protein